jgi:hydrogenase maturation protease
MRAREKGGGHGTSQVPRSSLAYTLIIGLGNPLRGDDGVGGRVVQALAEQALPDGVEVVDGGTEGLGIISLMQGRRRVILVDAADIGQDPGQFVRFSLQEVRLLGDDEHLSVHATGLRDVLLLAQALDILPDETIIFGVQPASLDWDSALSPEVEAALPELSAAVLAELPIADGPVLPALRSACCTG